MRSATSCFNVTLFKKNLTRFWPVWAVYLLVWIFVLPVNLLLNYENWPERQRFAHSHVLTSVTTAGIFLAAVFALLAAVAVWSYLFNNRSACLMHTLPIRRRGLFWTNFLSGMAFMAAPNLVIVILTLLAELAVGYVQVWPLVVWFLSVTLMELFFFCFATFCAMCTGHILGLPALYGVFNGLAAGVAVLAEMVLAQFVFGYTGNLSGGGLVRFLTPLWLLDDNLEVRMELAADGSRLYETAWLSGVGFILVYMLVGLILAGGAYALYRRRHMERAGDVIAVGWMRPVFLYGVAVCCALAFGTVLFELFGHELGETVVALLFFLLICGAAGYFVAKMLLEKSFRVFRYWKGCLPLLGALVVLVCAMEFDLTGYERRVPDADQVEFVVFGDFNTEPFDEASYAGVESDDPEVIAAAVALHQAIAENKAAIEDQEAFYKREYGDVPSYAVSAAYTRVNLSYKLKNNDILKREYWLPVYDSDLKDPDTWSARMDALMNLPQVVEYGYGLTKQTADSIVEMTLSTLRANEEENALHTREIAVSSEAWEAVFNAVLADMEEGNLGRRYLISNEERMDNCYVNDLKITFYSRINEMVESMSGDLPAVTVEEISKGTRAYTASITVTLQTTARHTLAALREIGALTEPVDLMTQTQRSLLSDAWELALKEGKQPDMTPFVEERLGE